MINKDGKTVAPSSETFAAAAANADWAKTKNFHLILANQPGADSWPMTAATFIIMYNKPAKTADSLIALQFFDWAFKNGDQLARDLHYVSMPDSVVKTIEKAISEERRVGKECVGTSRSRRGRYQTRQTLEQLMLK